ncbi:Lrp/AsnC family transcriptional regulator [Streptomyces sp. NBC_01456]|nr:MULTISPECIES: Lrp/AsnC family transcriptional regulator [unclassified Streptomyces]
MFGFDDDAHALGFELGLEPVGDLFGEAFLDLRSAGEVLDGAGLAALALDGRAGITDLAAAAGLTSGRTSRRLDALLWGGVVHIDVETAPMALGYRARANLWMRVHPAHIKTVGRTMATLPGVGFAAAVSGPCNLHAVVHCSDLDTLFEFTTDRVGTLPGVEGMEISPVFRQIKQAGTRVDEDRLSDPPPS